MNRTQRALTRLVLLAASAVLAAAPRAQTACPMEAGGVGNLLGSYCPIPSTAPPGREVVVPVFFHVISNTSGVGDVPRATIENQLDVLNAAFTTFGGDHPFTFVLVGIDRVQNNTWFSGMSFYHPVSGSDDEVKGALAVDPARVLNVYTADLEYHPTTNRNGESGYATYAFPFSEYPEIGTISAEGSFWQGVVVDYQTLPGSPHPRDGGINLVHEVGHYFGLIHTWASACNEGNCSVQGDCLCDTPKQPDENFDCDADDCAGGPSVSEGNFMDLFYDSCSFLFTDGQFLRMVDEAYSYRPSLGGTPRLPDTPSQPYERRLVAGADFDSPNGASVASGALLIVESGVTVRFSGGKRLVVSGTMQASGATFTAANPSQKWAGIVVANGQTTLSGGSRVEHAAIGVAVYDPAQVTITGANTTLADNTVGLAVLSRGGTGNGATLSSSATVSGNGTGITTDLTCTWTGGAPLCDALLAMRSRLLIADAFVTGNSGRGLYLLNTDVQAFATQITQNGVTGVTSGLTVANAGVFPFYRNTISGSGLYGAEVLAGGELTFRNTFVGGENTVANNASTEVWNGSGGIAFLGTAAQRGRNKVTSVAGYFVHNAFGNATLPAAYNYWGSSTQPAANRFSGAVNYCPFFACDPVNNPSCTSGTLCGTIDLQAGGVHTLATGGAARASWYGGFDLGGDGSLDSLRAEIRAVRLRLTAHPAAQGSELLVRVLAILHRLDRDDATGERAETFALFAALRARLALPGLPPALRPAVEAALEVEAADALAREAYDEAAALVESHTGLVEGGESRRRLTLVEAFLAARNGRRSEAAALVAAVAIEIGDEAERRGLLDLAAALAAEPGAGPDGAAMSEPLAGNESGIVEAGYAIDALVVAPNPTGGRATVALTLTAEGGVRVAVYDVLGRRTALLQDGALGAGAHAFAFDGSSLPTGVYVVRVEVEQEGSGVRTYARRLTLTD